MNVYNLLKEAANKWPSNYAIHEEHRSITFTELFSETELLKEELLTKGIHKGIGIGVMMKNSSNFIVSIFAGAGTSALVMPLAHNLKQSELTEITTTAGLHYILDDYSGIEPDAQALFVLNTQYGKLRLSRTNNDLSKIIAPHISDAAFMRFTSGTTGKSKGVIVSHQSVTERIEAANQSLQLGPQDAVVWVLPMAYHFLVSIVLYVKFGSAIIICKDFLANTIIDSANRFKGTLLYASPMHIRLLAADKSQKMLSSMKNVISTSTAITHQQCEEFSKRFQIPVSQAYGIIEIGLPIINFQKSAENPNSVGFALPDYQVEILDEQFTVLPHNSVGKLAIKGPGMFDGYLSPPKLRKDVLVNEWFLTGDLAIKSKDGLITVCGREKSMINVSGNKVFPEEVEFLLNAHPEVAHSKVFGIHHPLMGEIVKAQILKRENSNIQPNDLIEFCRKHLSTYKVPQIIEMVDELEMTGSGKIKRA